MWGRETFLCVRRPDTNQIPANSTTGMHRWDTVTEKTQTEPRILPCLSDTHTVRSHGPKADGPAAITLLPADLLWRPSQSPAV